MKNQSTISLWCGFPPALAIGISPLEQGVKLQRRKQINTEKQLKWVDPLVGQLKSKLVERSESDSSSIGVSHG